MDQLCYPVLKRLDKIGKNAQDYYGEPTYNYKLIVWETMLVEMDTINMMHLEALKHRIT
jgi:hypothetical protein